MFTDLDLLQLAKDGSPWLMGVYILYNLIKSLSPSFKPLSQLLIKFFELKFNTKLDKAQIKIQRDTASFEAQKVLLNQKVAFAEDKLADSEEDNKDLKLSIDALNEKISTLELEKTELQAKNRELDVQKDNLKIQLAIFEEIFSSIEGNTSDSEIETYSKIFKNITQ